MLDDRAKLLLKALVERYIADGHEAQVVAEWEVLVASAVQAVGWAADWSVCRSRLR